MASTYTHHTEKNICVVPTGGALTLDSPAKFKAYVLELLEEKSYAGLVIDCAALQRIDSFGIGVVVGLFKAAREKGVAYGIANLSESHQRLFQSTGIDQVLDLYPTMDDALAGVVD